MKQIATLLIAFSFLFIPACLKAQNIILDKITSEQVDSFYISATIIENVALSPTNQNETIKAYVNYKENPDVVAIIDKRYQGASVSEVITWFKQKTDVTDDLYGINNGVHFVTKEFTKPKGVDNFCVFGPTKLEEELSAFTHQKKYVFIFTVKQFAGEIEISISDKKTQKDAWSIAKDGINNTIRFANKW
jgi:hypothetical protein